MCFRDVQERMVVPGSAVGLTTPNTPYEVANIWRGLESVTLRSRGPLFPTSRRNTGPDLTLFCARPGLEPNGVGAAAGGWTLGQHRAVLSLVGGCKQWIFFHSRSPNFTFSALLFINSWEKEKYFHYLLCCLSLLVIFLKLLPLIERIFPLPASEGEKKARAWKSAYYGFFFPPSASRFCKCCISAGQFSIL